MSERAAGRRGFDFEQLVADIFEHVGFAIQNVMQFAFEIPEGRPSHRIDIIAKHNNSRLIVEVKYFRSPDARAEVLATGIQQLLLYIARYARPADNFIPLLPVFVTSAIVPPEMREGLVNGTDVVLVDGIDLLVLASTAPDLLDRLRSMLDWSWESWVEVLRRDRSRADILEDLGNPQQPASRLERPQEPPPTTGADLCKQLRSISKGRGIKNWKAYEEHCERIIEYLFGTDLGTPHKQRRTTDGLNRYDLIYRIKPANEFWRFLVAECSSRYIVFECKNYAKEIGQEEILTTEKYLFERAMRRVAIVLTRKGESSSAEIMRQGAMREHGKLILVLSDDDLCTMLHMRDNGNEPSDYLFERADTFLMKLPR